MTAGKISLEAVKSGAADLLDILKLNALLDHELAVAYAAENKR